jgi:tetratricopeptide (TPR) repeat protein
MAKRKKNKKIRSRRQKKPPVGRKKAMSAPDLSQHLAEAQRFLQAGHLESAEQACRKVLTAAPSQPAALSMLASIAIHTGNCEMALEYCSRALESGRPDPNMYILKGLAYYELEQFDAAVESYLEAIKINGSLPLAHYNLGNAYKARNSMDEAVSAYRNAIALEPNYFKAYNNLGNIYRKNRLFDDAVACFEKAISINPNVARIHKNLGVVYETLRETGKAMQSYERAVQLQPGYPLALAGMAGILEKKGEHDRAHALLAPVVDNLGEEDALVASTFGLICSSRGEQERAIGIIQGKLEQGVADKNEQKILYFALGKLYDELGRYDDAFACYDRGNTLHDEYFFPEENLNKVRRIMTFHAAGDDEISSNRSRLPVFIVGMPRSGTSLVEQIIACHPGVYGAGELNDIINLAGRLPQHLQAGPYPECEQHLTTEILDELAGEYLEMLKTKAGDDAVLRVTDKMPNNFNYLGLIRRLFPEATIIHCRRDPMDTCLSCFFQDFVGSHTYAYDLEHLGVRYRHYEYLMSFWRDELKIPMLEVQYEELVANQEEVSRKMIAHCGLEWDEACLNFHRSGRRVHTASFQQVRKPIYTSSTGRWKNYESYLDPLKKGLETRIE